MIYLMENIKISVTSSLEKIEMPYDVCIDGFEIKMIN